MSDVFDLVVHNARIVTCAGPTSGTPRERLSIIERGAIGAVHGRIAFVEDERAFRMARAQTTIDAGGRVVFPGLVDAHTHLVWAGSRVDEFARRMAGEDYRSIAAAGGGIQATVAATRATTDARLFELAAARARSMRLRGTTTVEVKSGYGLSLDDEMRCLRVARRLEDEGIVRVTTSFLGAHAVPPEHRANRAAYVDEVCTQMIPAVTREKLADTCDVYLDEGAFSTDEASTVLSAARTNGMRVRGHVGQFRDLGGAKLLADLNALSADHLEHVTDADITALAVAGVTVVLLPSAWRTLRQAPPDAARFRRAGCAIAVATDCNPGTSPCTDLPLCAALAVRDAGLTIDEALLSITCNGASALGREDVGCITPGAHADFAIYDFDDERALAYTFGGTIAKQVVLAGRVVTEAPEGASPVW